jgi:hypothetical protein
VRAHALKVEFHLLTRETDMSGRSASIRDPVACRAVLSSYLAKQIQQRFTAAEGRLQKVKTADVQEEEDALLETCHPAVLRICSLMEISPEEGLGRLVLELSQARQYGAAVRIARRLVDAHVTPDWAHMLQMVVYRLELELATRAGHQAENEEDEVAELMACLGRLAAQSLTYCEGPAITDGLELAGWQALTAWVCQESHSTKAFR